jgi:hypothetical protein
MSAYSSRVSQPNRMPIEEVFKVMWNRMNQIEQKLGNSEKKTYSEQTNGLLNNDLEKNENLSSVESNSPMNKFKSSDSSQLETITPAIMEQKLNKIESATLLLQDKSEPTTQSSSQLKEQTPPTTKSTQVQVQSQDYSKITNDVNEMKDLFEKDIKSLKDKNEELEKTLNTIKTSMKTIESLTEDVKSESIRDRKFLKENCFTTDIQELNQKYNQLNNFLIEIQTTQITINNELLKKFNDKPELRELLGSDIEEQQNTFNKNIIASASVIENNVEANVEAHDEVHDEAKDEAKDEVSVESKDEVSVESKDEAKDEVSVESKDEAKDEVMDEANVESKDETNVEVTNTVKETSPKKRGRKSTKTKVAEQPKKGTVSFTIK